MSNLRFKIKDEFISDSTQLVADAVTIHYVEIIDKYYDASKQKVPDDYQWNDRALAYYEYGFDNDGTMVPVIILEVEADRDDEDRDKYYYIGQVSIDGSAYDQWIKINNPKTHVPIEGWTSNTKQFIYTNVIVEDVPIKLNNFGLAEKTLKTANKWCTADIDVKIDSAELENIKSEYLRSDVEVFGISGSYGEAVDTVTIPAGIYELIFNPGSDYYAKGIFNFYYCGSLYTGFYVPPGNVMTFYRADGGSSSRLFLIGSSASNPGGMDESTTWLEYLVYVPEDMTVSKEDAEGWYSQMHPYVSSAALGTSTFKLPDELPGIGNDAPCAYIRKCLKNLGKPSANGFYIDGVIYDAKVPFVGGNTFSGIAFVDDYNQETSSILIKNATSSGYDRVLYFGEGGGFDAGTFGLSFDNSEDWQYWRMKNHYSEVTPEILAFLIAIGAEADPKHVCLGCGTSFYVTEFKELWKCNTCRSSSCNHYGDKTYNNNYDGTHQVICNQCSEVLNYSESHEYSEGYCVCGATSGSSCDNTNWVYYEGSWTAYPSEYDNATHECRCSGANCQCNFRAPFEGDTWPNCPCCGSDVNYVGYVGGDPGEPGDPDPDQYIECPSCGQYQYDGNVCHNCDYGKDIPDDTMYTCPSCSNPITSWDEYPYTGWCSEGHDVNFHDPEYCSHTKVNWQCTSGYCLANGTYCSGWSKDYEIEDWVNRGMCPVCHYSAYTY